LRHALRRAGPFWAGRINLRRKEIITHRLARGEHRELLAILGAWRKARRA